MLLASGNRACYNCCMHARAFKDRTQRTASNTSPNHCHYFPWVLAICNGRAAVLIEMIVMVHFWLHPFWFTWFAEDENIWMPCNYERLALKGVDWV